MLTVLGITGPIYIVIALGFLAGKTGVFSGADMRVLGKFVVKFALPALLFTALSQRPIGDLVNGRFLAAYALGSLAVFGAAAAFARRVMHRTVPLSVLIGMGTSYSNSGFIGYPIALQLLGPPAAAALAMCMIVENALMFPLTLTLAEMGEHHGKRWHSVMLQSLGALARNPMIISIFAGFAVSLLEIQLSDPLVRTVNMLANASTAVALFVIGGSLVGLRIKAIVGRVSAVALGKLLLHPLVILAMLWLLGPVDPELRMAGVVYASVPMLSIYPIVAQRYHEEGYCAAALLLAVLLSFLTVTGVLWSMTALLGWSV